MSMALLACARTGDPSHVGIPQWKPYTLEKRETLVFDVESKLALNPRGGERFMRVCRLCSAGLFRISISNIIANPTYTGGSNRRSD